MTRPYAEFTYNRRLVRGPREALTYTSHDYAILQDQLDTKFREHEAELFVEEGASGGEKWKPIDPDSPYGRWKRGAFAGAAALNRQRTRALASVGARTSDGKAIRLRGGRGSANKTLQLTGEMKESLTKAGHPEHVSRTEGAAPRVTFICGTTNPLAKYHFEGNEHLPVRNPIAHTEAQKRAYLEVLKSYVISKARAVVRSINTASSPTRKISA